MFPWGHITWLWFAIVITEWGSEGAFLCREATFLMASLTIWQETVFYFDFIIDFFARSITYTSARAIVEYVRKYSEKTCAFSKRWVFARKTLRFGRNRSVKRSAFRPNAAFFSTRVSPFDSPWNFTLKWWSNFSLSSNFKFFDFWLQ